MPERHEASDQHQAARKNAHGQGMGRWLGPARGGLSDSEYLEVRILVGASLTLAVLGLFTSVVFPLLLGFSLVDFAVNATGTAAMLLVYFLAMRGQRNASSTVLLLVLVAAIWATMVRNTSLSLHGIYILANLLPVVLAFTLGRLAIGITVTFAALSYMAFSAGAYEMPLPNSITVGIIFIALAALSVLAPVFRGSERRRAMAAESAQRAAQVDFQSLFEHMAEGFAHCRMLYEHGVPTDWVYLGVNQWFVELTGLHDVVGKRVSEVIPGIRQSNPELFEAYARVAGGGAPERLEVNIPSLDRWFSISVYSVRPGEFVAVFDNITERKAQDEAIRASEKRLRQAESLAHLGVWEMNLVSRAFSFSEEACRNFGLDPGTAVTYFQFLDVVHPEDRKRVEETLTTAIAREEPHSFEFRIQPLGGTTRIIHATGAPPEVVDGIPTLVVGSLLDITERREATQREAEVKRLQDLTKFRGELMNMVAHEIKNPITPIRLELALLRMPQSGKLTARGEKALGILSRNVERVVSLTNDLLEASRLEAGSVKLVRARIDLSRVAQEVCESFQTVAQSAGLVLACVAPRPVWAFADEGRVTQVLYNFVANAIKYTREGRIEVSVIGTGSEAIARVKDTGLGLTSEQRDVLFQPFVRVHDPVRRDAVRGTGLGLYVSKGVIELHAGKVGVESAGAGQGSTFWFSLSLD